MTREEQKQIRELKSLCKKRGFDREQILIVMIMTYSRQMAESEKGQEFAVKTLKEDLINGVEIGDIYQHLEDLVDERFRLDL